MTEDPSFSVAERPIERRFDRLTFAALALILVAACGRLGFDPARRPDANDAVDAESQTMQDGPQAVDATDSASPGPGEACLYTNPLPCGLVGTNLITSGSQSTADNTNVRGNDLLGSCARADGSGEFTVRYVATTAGVYSFSSAGSAVDTVLYILDGSCSGPELACNDDVAAGNPTSEVVISVVGGQTVIAVVDGAAGLCGAVELTVTAL